MKGKNIEKMVEAINEYNEWCGNEIRIWIEDDMIFVCYNALSDMDDIDEVNENWVNREHQRIIENAK